MKRAKRLSALLIVLVVVCIAAIAVTQMEERQEQIAATGEIVLEVDSSAVTSLAWTYEETSLAFHKDETWLYDSDAAFPVDQEKIGELLAPFEAFGVSFVIENVTDYGMYGLDDPVCTITLSTADEEYTITLGEFSELDEERYVSIGDGNVYLAKSDPLEEYDAVLSDLIDQDDALSYDQVSAIRFAGAADYAVSYEADSASVWFSDDVYFTEDGGETVPLSTDLVDSYLEDLATLHLTDYVTYNVTEEELASYGLDQPELTVEVDYTGTGEDGESLSGTYILAVSRDAEQLAAAQEAEEAGEEPEEVTGYVRVGDSQIVYRVSEDDCNALLAASYDDLRHREVLRADFDTVTGLDITLDGDTYTLSASEADGDGVRTWTYGETEADIADLQSALEGLSAASFTDESPDGKEEIALTVTLDNENVQEVEIRLYRCDGEQCLAVVDGRSVSLVPRSSVVDLIESINAIVL